MGRSIRISPEYFPEHYLVIQRYHLSRQTFCSWLVCWSHCLIVPQPLTVSYCLALASCCYESGSSHQPPDLVFTLMTNPVSLSNAQCRSEPHLLLHYLHNLQEPSLAHQQLQPRLAQLTIEMMWVGDDHLILNLRVQDFRHSLSCISIPLDILPNIS